MVSLTREQVAGIREALGRADPPLAPEHAEAIVAALRRQHEDPEDHDRTLIAERLAWSPERRLQELQAFLDLVAAARPAAA
jgi:hypothetical protein